METSITPSTYIRSLNFKLLRQLADFLDPRDGWRQIAVDIKKTSGEPRYTQLHIRRFETCLRMGKSPTCELIHDWGTTNCTVGDLVDLLNKNHFVTAARLLIPETSLTDQNLSSKDIGKVPPVVSQLLTKPSSTVLNFRQMEDLQDNDTDQNLSSKDIGNVSPVMSQLLTKPSSTVLNFGQMEDLQDNDTECRMFSFHELMRITGNFNDQPVSAGGHKLGEGGFGVVYKGSVNGRSVAVKKLSTMVGVSIQELKVQFDQEIQTLTMCQHENLVELIGFSSDDDHQCLVYLFMPNGSLLDRLACLDGTAPLSWSVRFHIAWGTANGLNYLHENHHVHRDIKSANILLNETFVPKISDFGLTRAFEKCSKTVMTERIVGTTAYMAPEALRGEITIKSDIFSLGVVFLEIITGLPAMDEDRDPPLLIDIQEEIEDEEKTLGDYLDGKMEDFDSIACEEMYSIAGKCLHQLKNKRPDIKKVIEELEKIGDNQ